MTPTVHGHNESITFPDYGITTTALLDSGAHMTCVPAANLHISAGVASFDFCGVHIETPVLRTITLTGFTNQASQHPVIALMITVGAHTAREEIALSLPGTTILVGRTFMAGRIIVNPDKRW